MKHEKARKRTNEQDDASMARLFSNLRYSLPATLGVFLFLSLVVALLLYFLPDPSPYTLPLSYLAAAVTAFFGGWFLCKKQKNSALLCGLINGTFFLCILLLLSLFFRAYATGYSPLVSAALHLGFLALSIAGGYIGLPRSGKRPKKR